MHNLPMGDHVSREEWIKMMGGLMPLPRGDSITASELAGQGKPQVVRVANFREAEWYAHKGGLRKNQWVYIGDVSRAHGRMPKEGITYYVQYDVPYTAVEARWNA